MEETNLIKCVGVIPTRGADPIPVGKIPYGGTQIAISKGIENDEVIVRTVGGGSTLYLSAFTFSVVMLDVADVQGQLFVRNADDLYQYNLGNFRIHNYGHLAISASFMPPLEIPTAWDIVLTSDTANCFSDAFIHGYET